MSATLIALAVGTLAYGGGGITLHTHAERLPVLLERLSEHSDVRLVASRELENEVVMARLTDRPPAVVMVGLAKALSAEWRRESGALIIHRPAAVRRAWEQQFAATRSRRMREAVTGFIDNAGLGAPFSWREAQAALRETQRLRASAPSSIEGLRLQLAAEQRMTGGRTIARILAQIDSDRLARLGEGEWIVFASHPTRLQEPVPGAAGILAAFAEEHAALVEAAGTEAPDTGLSITHLTQDEFRPRPLATRPAKFVLRVDASLGSMNLLVADGDGNTLHRYETNAGFRLLNPPHTADPTFRGSERLVAFRPESAAFLRAVYPAIMGRRIDREPLTAHARAMLLDPLAHDPLSFHASDALAALADEWGEDLIAWVPDSLLLPPPPPTQTWTTAAFADRIARLVSLEEHDGIRLLVPLDPLAATRRIDRRFLRDLANSAAQSGVWGLDLQAAVAMREPWVERSNPLQLYRRALAYEVSATQHVMPREALRLYGAIPDSRRRHLDRGYEAPVASLSGEQRRSLEAWLFGARTLELQRRADPAPPSPTHVVVDGIVREMPKPADPGVRWFGGIDPWLAEPTNRFPNGLPSDSVLRIQVEAAMRAYSGPEGSVPRLDAHTPQSLARRVDVAARGAGVAPDRFWAGTERIVRMEVDLGDSLFLQALLPDAAIDLSRPPVPLESLPAGFREEYAKALEILRGSTTSPASGGRRPPP
jgi:hypothetical protein